MMLRVWGIAALALLAACASEANYEKILQSWVGRHQDDLVAAWGPPDRTAPLSSGGAVWEYEKRHEVTTGGYTYYTYEPVTTTGTVSSYGSTGTYAGTTTVAVPHTTPERTAVRECTARFTMSPQGAIQNWSHEGNACVAEETSFWLKPGPAAAPAAITTASVTTPQVSSVAPPAGSGSDESISKGSTSTVASVGSSSAAMTREYPEAHISIASAAPFSEKTETLDPYMPPYVQLSQQLDGGPYVVVSFSPMGLPVIEPEDYVTDLADKDLTGQQIIDRAATYSTWRGFHSARAKGHYVIDGQTYHYGRRVVWLQAHKGVLTLVSMGVSERDALDGLDMLERAVGVI